MRRGKAKRITETISFKVKQYKDTQTTDATASSLAKEARSSSTVDADRIYSNRGSGKDKYSNSMLHSESRIGIIQPLYLRDRQEKELL